MTIYQIIANTRLGANVKVHIDPEDKVEDLKKMIAAQSGTKWQKIVLKKNGSILKNHLTIRDCEIANEQSLDLSYS